jgi:protease inhibitor Inh
MGVIAPCRAALAAALAFAFAGCGLERFSNFEYGRSGHAPAQADAHARAPVEMTGRWRLASPGRGECAMTFQAVPGAVDGTIAPEGGCPGDFFTSRKWGFEQANLVIRNHNGEALAQLTLAAATRFDGKSVTGEPVTLTR